MDPEFLKSYDRLNPDEDNFLITKADLNILTDSYKIESQIAYSHLSKLGGVEGLFKRLDVNPTHGIDEPEDPKLFELRKKLFGTYQPPFPTNVSILNCFLEAFQDRTMIFLIFAATLRLVIDIFQRKNGWFDYSSIYIVVIMMCSMIAFTQFYKKKVLLKFQIDIDYKDVRVLRRRNEILIPKTDLVVGDILIISAGDILPVDGIVILAYSITIDSGKDKTSTSHYNINYKKLNRNYKQEKLDEFPILLAGSKITKGYAHILVLSVSEQYNLNKFNDDIQSKYIRKESRLQKSLKQVSGKLSMFGITVSILAGLNFLISYILNTENTIDTMHIINVLVDAVIYGVVLIVVAVPAGLQLVVTLALAFSVYKMKEENTIIKDIEACENMACIDTICTDYIGLLTKNDMKINSIYIEDKFVEGRDLLHLRQIVDDNLFNFFCESAAVNSTAYAADKDQSTVFVGDPLECSLIRYLSTLHIDYTKLRNDSLRPIIDCSPVSHDHKLSYTVIEMDDKRDKVRLYVKGSCEALLDNITTYIGSEISLEPLIPKQYEKIQQVCKKLTREGHFPLLFCYRDINVEIYNQIRQEYLAKKDSDFMSQIVRQLNFICIVGMKDELKGDSNKYISDCIRAGVTVRLFTNQDKESARIAARNCNIIDSSRNSVISRQEDAVELSSEVDRIKKFSKYSYKDDSGEIIDANEDLRRFVDAPEMKGFGSLQSFEFGITNTNLLKRNIEDALVIARAKARDKFIFTTTLKNEGHVIAVTGDGVSDFLAMKVAHVGISMGKTATDISKDVADVILTDDNFSSIITAIVYGRNIFDSIRKYLLFQISAVITVCALVLISCFPLINFYFYPNQLLYINLIFDGLGSISFAAEHPDRESILTKRPYDLNAEILNKSLMRRIMVQSLAQLAILITLLFTIPILFNIEDDFGLNYKLWQVSNGIHTTMVFTCIIYMQIFNAFVSRNLDNDNINLFKGLSNNRMFIGIQIAIFLFQILIVSYNGSLTRTRRLHLSTHIYCFLISSIYLLIVPLIKFLNKRKFFD
jgi:Ca2+ transporting ATPase